MTREEAIKELDTFKRLAKSESGGKALDMAIELLAKIPKHHGRIADMDAAIKCIEDCEGENAIWAISLIEWACSKRTLIEAESEVEE